MKKTIIFKFSLFFVAALCVPYSYAEDSLQWHLPETAKARLGRGSISEIKYSPDGKRLAVASSIGIWLYDTETHKEAAFLTGDTGDISGFSFSPDGGTIASASDGADVLSMWDAETGKRLRTVNGHGGWVISVSFSPNGDTFAGGTYDDTIHMWDAETGKAPAYAPRAYG